MTLHKKQVISYNDTDKKSEMEGEMGGEMEGEMKGEMDGEMEGIKHPLQHSWGFWMLTTHKRTWEENLVKLTTFDTVEDYWCLYHHMKRPTELSLGQDYAIFKNDVRPMWEDRANKSGGRWLITLDRKKNNDLDAIWLYVVLLLIGENFEHSKAICGAVVNVRVKSKIGIWMSDVKDKNAIMSTGRKLKEELTFQLRINFHVHNSTENMYTI